MSALQTALDAISRDFAGGTLIFTVADGRRWTLGHGDPQAEVRLRDAAVLRRILRNPGLHFGETYMDGAWEPAHGDLRRVLEIGTRFQEHAEQSLRWSAPRTWLARLAELNNPLRARRNVEHHYNLDNTLYQHFLGENLFYSCAYFERPDQSLDAAQHAKCELIARKLDLKPGARVLDIGCGWGGLAIHLAQAYGAQVTGITLSSEQLAMARQRVMSLGLQRQVELRLEDYRRTRGTFDAVVSVGMFEHVGRPQYRQFFDRIGELLTPDGTALLHTIGRLTPPGRCNPWIRKYIFPGGYIPAASETLAAQEAAGLMLTDLEVWRLHYALTLQRWNERFQAARSEFAARLGERFCRMWEFYLLGCEAAFRWGNLVVFHLQLSRALERLPMTRDYLYTPAPSGRGPHPHTSLDAPQRFPYNSRPIKVM